MLVPGGRSVIRIKDLFCELLAAHRHSISGSRASPVEKIRVKIIPNLINMWSTKVILKEVKRLGRVATLRGFGRIYSLHLPRIDMIGLNYGARDRLTGSDSGRETERKQNEGRKEDTFHFDFSARLNTAGSAARRRWPDQRNYYLGHRNGGGSLAHC
jgi:hypothetical protein